MKAYFILNILQISLVAALPRPHDELLHPILKFRPVENGLSRAVLIVDKEALALEASVSQFAHLASGAPAPTSAASAQHLQSSVQATPPVLSTVSVDTIQGSSPLIAPATSSATAAVVTPVAASSPAQSIPPSPTPSAVTVESIAVVSPTSAPLETSSSPTAISVVPSAPATHDKPVVKPTSVPPPAPSHAVQTEQTSSQVTPPSTSSTTSVSVVASPAVNSLPEPPSLPPTSSANSPPPPATTLTTTANDVSALPSTPALPALTPAETYSSVSIPSTSSTTSLSSVVTLPTPAAASPATSGSPQSATQLTSVSAVATSSSSTSIPSTTSGLPLTTSALSPTTSALPAASTPLGTSTPSTTPVTSPSSTPLTLQHNTNPRAQESGTSTESQARKSKDPKQGASQDRRPSAYTVTKGSQGSDSTATRKRPVHETAKPKFHLLPKNHTEAHDTHVGERTRLHNGKPAGPTSFTKTTQIVISTITRTTVVSRVDRFHRATHTSQKTITDTITVTVTRWVPCDTTDSPPTARPNHKGKAPARITLTSEDRKRPPQTGKESVVEQTTHRKFAHKTTKHPARPTTRPETRTAARPTRDGVNAKNPADTSTSKRKPPVVSVAPSVTVTLETTLTTSEIQTVTISETVTAQTKGTVHTTLPRSGHPTNPPFRTSVIHTSRRTISPIKSGTNHITTLKVSPTAPMSGNIFVAVTSGPPPPQVTKRGNHPVPPLGIVNQTEPLETNKFYANFFLGNRDQGTWTHPYSVAWARGGGAAGSWGISVSHIDRTQLTYGPVNILGYNGPVDYYVNPIGIQSMILSARELGAATDLTMDSLSAFSANVNLAASPGSKPLVTFPLVQGMGFVTAVYDKATPLIQSGVFFKTMTYTGKLAGGIARYDVTLNDGTKWLIYVRPRGGSTAPTLTLASSSIIVGSNTFYGSIQIAKNPAAAGALYDQHAGAYPIRGNIAASVSKATGEYTISWTKGGDVTKKLLMFALPHHVQTLSSSTAAGKTALQMVTTTKGMATAISADRWTLVENDLPFDMGFAPWSPWLRSRTTLPPAVVNLMNSVAAAELSENFTSQTDLDSMYFSGKGLAKFAMIVYATSELAKNKNLASAGLVKLKQSYKVFVDNKQVFPLDYDTTWGGVVSSAGYSDAGADFGNTYYNDHHFHYGYFVYTAAVIGALDPSWLTQGTNKQWVDSLVRDYANPVKDGYFPFSRMFDWYHGHSWAHGIIESGDGKDQESSSEDAFASYALKMWGRTVGDANMEARGNLMLALQARSLGNYYLMQNDNHVEPSNFIGNKAAGIIFENKIDHTTYFGTNIEYIEGIHMLPLNPSSTLTRSKGFVQQEWDTYFSNGRVNSIAGGWRGILYANLAIIDPKTAYDFFASPSFNNEYLDGGASRTWYLAFCAGLGGAG